MVIDEESQAHDLYEVTYVPGAIWPEDEAVVERYDPHSQIIVVFLHGDEGWNLHRVGSLPPPPVAVTMHPVERSFRHYLGEISPVQSPAASFFA